MKIIFLLFMTMTALFSNVYYSKVEPIEVKNISSNVAGVVSFIDEDMIGKKLSKKPFLKIDSQLDEDELKYTKEKLVFLRDNLVVYEKMLENIFESLKKKRDNYEKVKDLKIKSTIEKDREFYDLVTSENAYLSTQREINSLKIQISDLELRQAQLVRSIQDKNLKEEGCVLYSLNVKVGQVVTMSTPLASVVDTSKALLTIFLNEDDVANSKNRVIYLDDKKTDYKISRLLNIADSKNISKYMAQIVIDSPKIFSKLVKIELKEMVDAK